MSNKICDTLLSDEKRKLLSNDPRLGCGNFLHYAVANNPKADQQFFWMDRECVTFQGETFQGFSLTELKRVSDVYAALYHRLGVKPKDPVAVYVGEGIKNLIHYVALTGLGAIPILINGKMPIKIAAGFIKKSRAMALFTESAREEILETLLDKNELSFVMTDEKAGGVADLTLPSVYPYQHHENDIVLVGHSSGTTGIPKAVMFQHQQFFHGLRYRLGLAASPGAERILSALPHSHSAGLAYITLAVLNGNSTMVLSSNAPETVLPSIEYFHPTMVVAFPETFVEMCQHDFNKYDLSSIRLWMNGGDAAHEAHIRKLIAHGSRNREGKTVPGSVFIDGLGSSEMGFSLFRMVHTPESNIYNRCIGHSLEWVDAAIIGENGERLGPNQVGKLGVKSPTITPGYWNDSLLSARSQVNGYWLTGDLFFQDEEGRFFHVDRVPDAIKTKVGMVYSLQTEEFLMQHLGGDIADCTVVGIPDTDGSQAPVGFVRLNKGVRKEPSEILSDINHLLRSHGKIGLNQVLMTSPGMIPLGPTGKVLKRELREAFQTLIVGKKDARTHLSA